MLTLTILGELEFLCPHITEVLTKIAIISCYSYVIEFYNI